jgi:hypothetical protein
MVKKNVLRPWVKAMWCIGKITQQYRERMYELCDLYGKAYDAQEPVICVDEKSKQLLEASRPDLPARLGITGHAHLEDYEYIRKGKCNIFVAVEPKGGNRHIQVTDRRTKEDFVGFMCGLLNNVYSKGQFEKLTC